MSRATAHINLKALQNNFQIVKSYAPNAKILAMIKANAYGHGIVRVATALQQADALGVASLEEALRLREADIKNAIVIMDGIFSIAELELAAKNNLELVIHDSEQIKILAQTPLANPIKIWLQIDTGMHRLGFLPEEFKEAYEQLKKISYIHPTIILMTHLANADDLTNKTNEQQLKLFEKLTAAYQVPKSIANSAAILTWQSTPEEWIRPGLMLYGASPFKDKTAAALKLQPVMTLTSKLIAIKHLKKGDAVGYGGTWQCPEDMPVGVVAIGYGDGYSRHAKNGTPILINDKRCALIGRVSMDMLTVDLRNNPMAKMGDKVILWGEGLPIEEIAECADTIPYTLFCGVTKRVTSK